MAPQAMPDRPPLARAVATKARLQGPEAAFVS